jgi:hypothetical protein
MKSGRSQNEKRQIASLSKSKSSGSQNAEASKSHAAPQQLTLSITPAVEQHCELRRLAGKRNPRSRVRQNSPTGKLILIFRSRVKSGNQKYSCFHLTRLASHQ